MHKISGETLFCDIDNTLVKHNDILNPEDTLIDIDYDGKLHTLGIYQEHILILKEYYSKGFKIIVWSAGGADWAGAVIKALELSEYIEACITKPFYIIDDIPLQEDYWGIKNLHTSIIGSSN